VIKADTHACARGRERERRRGVHVLASVRQGKDDGTGPEIEREAEQRLFPRIVRHSLDEINLGEYRVPGMCPENGDRGYCDIIDAVLLGYVIGCGWCSVFWDRFHIAVEVQMVRVVGVCPKIQEGSIVRVDILKRP